MIQLSGKVVSPMHFWTYKLRIKGRKFGNKILPQSWSYFFGSTIFVFIWLTNVSTSRKFLVCLEILEQNKTAEYTDGAT